MLMRLESSVMKQLLFTEANNSGVYNSGLVLYRAIQIMEHILHVYNYNVVQKHLVWVIFLHSLSPMFNDCIHKKLL